MSFLTEILDSPSRIAAFVLLAIIINLIVTAVYRVTLHPLAKIPGPKLAAITQLYQTYYSQANGHSIFYQKVADLHDKYGPVVRITPNEVSLSDPEHYEKIYSHSTKYTKAPEFYSAFNAPISAFATSSNELHRIRRGALNPMFSRKSVLALEDLVQNIVSKLILRLEKDIPQGKETNLHFAYRAISIDAITGYAFDDCYELVSQDDFGEPFFRLIWHIISLVYIYMQFPLLQKFLFSLPKWAIPSASTRKFLNFASGVRVKVLDIKKHYDAGELDTASRTTIFRELLNPKAVSGHVVPPVDRMVDDAVVFLLAATDTTGNAMTIASYHILKNPEIYARLKEELVQAFPDPTERLDFLTLEKLPYLTGVIKEGLRLSFGVAGRLPRVVPPSGAEFNGYEIPPGMVVGMSSWIMHHNPNIFPSPDTFDPTRWLDPKQAQYLEKYLVAFGKGNRQCIGMPLAYVELYVTIGTVFYRFPDLVPNGITDKDIVMFDRFGSTMEDDATLLHVHKAT